jgi:hypothetical protein
MRVFLSLLLVAVLAGCGLDTGGNASKNDREAVEHQQLQYQKGQPIPVFNWSLERDLMIALYKVRNQKADTHSVWRSDRGMIEGDCPSYGYGMPYDTSLTNPLKPVGSRVHSLVSVEQAEPNGIFASKNTAATWVMCLGEAGTLEPVYVETKVTVYPGSVKVDYETNRVVRFGKATVTIKR